jgi:RNA polymerase sigma factor (sigma-70 family)
VEAMGNAGIALARRGDGPDDHELVRLVRRGDDRAFELLYHRYERRIGAYVLGMVKDHGRAEDITQEVFVAALRRMSATERPIAFKPWIYEIARNACIDAYRRSRRGEEVSYDGGDKLSPADQGRLVAAEPEPPAAVAAKQDLDTVLGAFGGLSDAHHEILVMRELEGMSYAAIGERMGMSRAGVESTLFRARKRLGEEYGELASGARCLRVQGIIAAGGNDKLGARDARRLARHVAHCQPCRRLALEAGFEVPARRGLGGRIAAWLPLPGFLRFGGWGTQRVAELLEPGWGKVAAGAAALLLAGAGAEQVITHGGGSDARAGEGAAQGAAARDGGSGGNDRLAVAGAPVVSSARSAGTGRGEDRTTGDGGRAGGAEGGLRDGDGAGGGAQRSDPGGGQAPAAGGGRTADAGGSGAARDGGGGKDPVQPVRDTVDNVDDTVDNVVQNTGQTVQNTTQNVTNTADNLVDNVQQTVNEPENLVPNVADTVDQTVNDAGGVVDGAVNDVGGTVNEAVDDVGGTVDGLLKP